MSRYANIMLTIAVVLLGFEAVMFVAAIFGEVSMAVTIVSGYNAGAVVVGMLCYFGFGIILTALSVCALVPVARGIADARKLTKKSADLSIDLCILIFIALIAIFIGKTTLEPILTSDILCTLYYACYSYSGISIVCGVVALVAAVLVHVAYRQIAAAADEELADSEEPAADDESADFEEPAADDEPAAEDDDAAAYEEPAYEESAYEESAYAESADAVPADDAPVGE